MNVFITHVNGNEGTLTPDESWHCARVLRKRSGETVHLIDGVGNFYTGALELVTDRKCTVRILDGPRPQPTRNYHLHLAIAPTKQMDRVEWMIEKCVEIGIDEISFVISRNSERTVVKRDRVMKIVESAVKQSLQAKLPVVNDNMSFETLVKQAGTGQKLIAHCFDLPRKELKQITFGRRQTLALIGPEGDFTREEVDQACGLNFEPVSLGTNRLRSETAGLYVCQAASILSSLNL